MPKTNIEERIAFERIRGEVIRQSKVRNWNVPEGELDYVVSEAIKDAMEESRTLALKEAEEAAPPKQQDLTNVCSCGVESENEGIGYNNGVDDYKSAIRALRTEEREV